MYVAFASCGKIPKAGVTPGICTCAPANDVAFVCRYEYVCILAQGKFKKLLVGRNEPAEIEPRFLVQNFIEIANLFLCCRNAYAYTFLCGMVNIAFRFWCETLFGMFGVQRVMDLLPIYAEIAFGAEISVAEHFLR